MASLGKLTEIKDLRTIWPHEAKDFTPWLAQEENMDLLADAVGLEISVDETESSVGDFSVDILASEVGTDRKIIIENQLEDTNHDHLGKLITYASGKGADVVIWVVRHAREEHKSAIEWLNNHTDEHIGFFLVEIKLFKIGDSEPAPKFEIIEQPNDWTKEAKKVSGALSQTQQARLEYWAAFNEYAFSKPFFAKAFRPRKPSTDHWMSLAIGSSDIHIDLLQERNRNTVGASLWIADNKDLYHTLESHKAEIEAETGITFEWSELPGKKASKIVVETGADYSNESEWPSQFDWMMDVAVKLKKATKKYL